MEELIKINEIESKDDHWNIEKEKNFIQAKLDWFQKQGKSVNVQREFLLHYQQGMKFRHTGFNGEGQMLGKEREAIMNYVDEILALESEAK